MAVKRQIGQRMKSLKTLKQSMQKKQAGLVQYIPKNGEITVRFIEEPEGNWVKFGEHYDQMRRMSFPCVGDDCSGCDDSLRRTDRFLANAVDIEKDKAIVIQLPKGLAETLVKYYERNDTLLDRDYTLVREGEGMDTDYYPQPEEKLKRKLTSYEPADLDDILDKLAQAYFGSEDDDDEDEDDEDERPVKKKTRSAAAPKKRTRPPEPDADDEDDDDEDDEEEAAPPRKATKKAAPKAAPPRRKRPDPVEEEEEEEEEEEDEDDIEEDDDDVEEDDDDDDPEEDGDEYYTEKELSGMTVGALRVICKEYDIESTGLKKPELVAAILG